MGLVVISLSYPNLIISQDYMGISRRMNDIRTCIVEDLKPGTGPHPQPIPSSLPFRLPFSPPCLRTDLPMIHPPSQISSPNWMAQLPTRPQLSPIVRYPFRPHRLVFRSWIRFSPRLRRVIPRPHPTLPTPLRMHYKPSLLALLMARQTITPPRTWALPLLRRLRTLLDYQRVPHLLRPASLSMGPIPLPQFVTPRSFFTKTGTA